MPAVHKVDYFSTVNRISRQAVGVPSQNSLRFAFLNARNHFVKNWPARNFGRLFFNKHLRDFYIFSLGKRAQFRDLVFNRPNLFIFHICGLAGIQKEFLHNSLFLILFNLNGRLWCDKPNYLDCFQKTAIKKVIGLFVALSLYHNQTKSKNSFCQNRKRRRPHFAKPRGAPQRAERNEFPLENALGGALRRPRKFRKVSRKSDYCAFIQLRSNLSYQKFLEKTTPRPASWRGGAETQKSLGRGGKKKGCGENEFPPRLRLLP